MDVAMGEAQFGEIGCGQPVVDRPLPTICLFNTVRRCGSPILGNQ